jgi:perosamine synthetase
MLRRVRLAPPLFTEGDISAISDQISSVLRSGWLTSGPLVERLEDGFKRVSGTRYAIAMSSGTAALHAIMAAQDLKRDDEVIVPANTFASTANAVLYVGAKPVLADCDPETFNVTSETIERCTSEKTKVVMVTHVGGNPCEMDPIIALCKERGLTLSEDAAHAAGSTYRGKRCGALSWAAAFSLYATKVVTSAEGGILGTDSKALRDFAWTFRNAGREQFGSGPIVSLGYNYRMTDIHAAIGLRQLARIGRFVARRNRLASLYDKVLSDVSWLKPQLVARHSKSSYYSYLVRLLPDSPLSRDELARRLKSKGVETTVMFRPIHMQPYFKRYSMGPFDCPNAEAVGLRSLALPMHAGMSDEDVSYVVRSIQSA